MGEVPLRGGGRDLAILPSLMGQRAAQMRTSTHMLKRAPKKVFQNDWKRVNNVGAHGRAGAQRFCGWLPVVSESTMQRPSSCSSSCSEPAELEEDDHLLHQCLAGLPGRPDGSGRDNGPDMNMLWWCDDAGFPPIHGSKPQAHKTAGCWRSCDTSSSAPSPQSTPHCASDARASDTGQAFVGAGSEDVHWFHLTDWAPWAFKEGCTMKRVAIVLLIKLAHKRPQQRGVGQHSRSRSQPYAMELPHHHVKLERDTP